MSDARVSIRDVEVRLSGRTIVAGACIVVEPGEVAMLVGPNGSGKSTLLRTVYRSLRATCGTVHVAGNELWSMSAREAARHIAALTQERSTDTELTVTDVVAVGRLPRQRPFVTLSRADASIISAAMGRTGVSALAARRFNTLSGGECQRVLIAKILAQGTDIVVLDEPTNHLDIRHQFALLDLLRSSGLTVLAAIHDLGLAAAYADRIHVLSEGRIEASGAPADVLTSDAVARVFGIRTTLDRNPIDGRLRLSTAPGIEDERLFPDGGVMQV